MIALNASVYGTSLNLTVAVGLLVFFAGVVMFAIAISRSQTLPRKAGIVLAASIPVFGIGSITGTRLDTIGALMQIGSAIWIAVSASRTRSPSRSTAVASHQQPPALAAFDA